MRAMILQPVGRLLRFAMLLLVALAAAQPSPVLASVSGPNYPTTVTQTGSGVGVEPSWSNPMDIISDNDVYASVILDHNVRSRFLRPSGFGFQIPEDAIINGIEVTIGRNTSTAGTPNLRDDRVQLMRAGTAEGDNKAKTAEDWSTGETASTYGGSADLWGLPWTPADINVANFGVNFRAINNSGVDGLEASVDYIRITVTYTLPTLASTTLTVSSVTGAYGSTANLSAVLSNNDAGGSVPVGRTVYFYLNGTDACSAVTNDTGTASCSALLNITPGTYLTGVEAVFEGDATYQTSHGSASLTVDKAGQTITITTPAPDQATAGSTFSIAATSSSGLPVSYSASGSCTNTGSQFTLTAGPGSCTVHYNQPGNTNYNAADEITEQVQVLLLIEDHFLHLPVVIR